MMALERAGALPSSQAPPLVPAPRQPQQIEAVQQMKTSVPYDPGELSASL